MHMSKPDPDILHRILHRHQWSDVADWVHALDDLAGLNDKEIEQLVSSPQSAGERAEGPRKKQDHR